MKRKMTRGHNAFKEKPTSSAWSMEVRLKWGKLTSMVLSLVSSLSAHSYFPGDFHLDVIVVAG